MADQKLTKEKSAAKKTAKSTGTGKGGSAKTGGKTPQAAKNSSGKSTRTKKSVQTNGAAEKTEEPLSASMKEEIALAVTLLVSVLFFLSYINLCGSVGKWLNTFIFGMVGIFGYLFPFLLFFGAAFFISNRKNRIARRKLICSAAFFICLAALIELLSAYDPEQKWTQYFTLSAEEKNGGGILGGTLVFLLCPLFDTVATTVILIILMIICLMIVTGKELFAYIRSVTGAGMPVRQSTSRRRQPEAVQEEYDEEEYQEEEYWLEKAAQKKRVLIFPKSGESGAAQMENKEPVRFVDALKARGRKGKNTARMQENIVPGMEAANAFAMEETGAELIQEPMQDARMERQAENTAPASALAGDASFASAPVFSEDKGPETVQEIAGITITGNYQQEDVSFYEEELKRKFGEAKNDTTEVERTFYDVSVSEHGTMVKENDVTLIRKDWFGDEEPLIPQKERESPMEEAEREQASEQETVVENEEETGAAAEFISADMIFASAGIDPTIHTFQKRGKAEKVLPSGSSVLDNVDLFFEENRPSDTPEPVKENAVLLPFSAGGAAKNGSFWPDMSVDTKEEAPFSGIRIAPAQEENTESSAEPDAPFLAMSEGAEDAVWQDMPLQSNVDRFASQEPLFQNMPPQDGSAPAVSKKEAISADISAAPDRASIGTAGKAEDAFTRPARSQNASAAFAGTNTMPVPPSLPVPEKKYEFPPIDLLEKPVQGKGANERELKETAIKLQNTLQSFGVRVTVTNISCGPAVTQYELQPEQGVKVNQITKLSDDIKLNLAATDIRIEAPIPGKAAVGIEVPNKENSPVILRELLESTEFKEHKSRLAFAVGKNISGQIVVSDIAKMPHMLIAGATGSGKSVCINTIIMSILYKADPKDVKLIMVDPKVVELSVYNGIPHLLIPVVTDPKKASAALNWAVAEMTDRYQKFAALSVRDLAGYNEKVAGFEEQNPAFPRLPQIVIIVDELADLMMVASANEVEDAICRLAQMARAAGLHLILATQRPSVNVITGVIKANVPSRVAFAVTSAVDSRTILDGVGAERLLGKGDMLFFPSGYPKPVRIQGAFVSDAEVSAVVDFLKEQAEGMNGYNEEVNQRIMSAASGAGGPAGSDGNDDYFVEAGRYIIEKQKASIGMLQRVYKIGFNRAARIMDQLTAAGVVGPEEGTKPRKILMTQAEFEEYLGL